MFEINIFCFGYLLGLVNIGVKRPCNGFAVMYTDTFERINCVNKVFYRCDSFGDDYDNAGEV